MRKDTLSQFYVWMYFSMMYIHSPQQGSTFIGNLSVHQIILGKKSSSFTFLKELWVSSILSTDARQLTNCL